MINPLSDTGQVAYNVQEYVLDFKGDLPLLSQVDCAAGSTAIVIEDGSIYIKNSRGEWKEF